MSVVTTILSMKAGGDREAVLQARAEDAS
jgi:hypothetical protein